MDRWIGRVALVTGASCGIGAAICRDLVKAGLKVVGCARGAEKISALASKLASENAAGELHSIRCDLTNEEDISAMFTEIETKYKRLDICINNAGLAHPAPLLTGLTKDWKNMIDVNVMALSICTREAFKIMEKYNIDDGQFININSMSGHRVPPGNTVNFYSSTKFMVTALTEGLRKELLAKKTNIRAVQISPGVVETRFQYNLYDEDKVKELFSRAKWLQSEDVSAAVMYVLSCPEHVNVNDIKLRPVEQEA